MEGVPYIHLFITYRFLSCTPALMSISTHTPFITSILWDSTTEKERVEGSHNISDDGYSEYATVAVSKQDFSTRKQNILSM